MSDEFKIRTLMSIDDCDVDQMLYKRIIKRAGIVEKVITFQLAEDALAYLKSDGCEEIDVILLDINMPRMNGFEFLEQATKELDDDVLKCVVVMLTTSLNPQDEKRARDFDVVKAYLNKPLAKEDLESVAQLVHSSDR